MKKITGWKARIDVVMNDQEAFAFAGEIADIFRTAGWSTEDVNQAIWSKSVFGAFLFIGEHSPDREAQLVANIFLRKGLPLKPCIASDIEPKEVLLRIGAKK